MTRRIAIAQHRLDVLTVALYAGLVATLAFLYLRVGVAAENGAPLMPVDDAYIHFQYAKQAANGQPFVYNPGMGPTSGATSLLYPFVLAAGYALGFTGLSLGWWAALIGVMALFASALTLRAMGRAAGLSRWLADMLGAAVAVWGAGAWHAFSGMETMLVVAFTLLTLHTFERQRRAAFILCAVILAMLRPEASVMAVIAGGMYALREWRQSGIRRGLLIFALPIAAATVQPLLNLALTGSATASGSQAKSLLSMIPFDFSLITERITTNYGRVWAEFALGFDEMFVWYLPPLLGAVALVGLLRGLRWKSYTVAMALLWLLVTFAAIATLDTAFWHFKRYHMPLLALAFPLLGWVVASLSTRAQTALIGAALVLSAYTNIAFLDFYADNVTSIARQPLQMMYWLRDNTPDDALIAVHDVGLMRYLGERATLDMVGLTTEGAADSWRNGPGAVGEYLIHAERRPDLIAAYTTARGLSYLADSLYGDVLAGFQWEYDPNTNIALGGPFQGIYEPTWEGASEASEPHVTQIRRYVEGMNLIDMLNVAELESERAHEYAWSNVSRFDGFATEMYLFDTPGCAESCRVLDGGRRMNGAETFTMAAEPGRDHILVTRFHAPDGGMLRVFVNGEPLAERTLPVIRGQFIEIPTLISRERVTGNTIEIRVEPVVSGAFIFPYRHWLYAGDFAAPELPQGPPMTFQDGAIALSVDADLSQDVLTVDLSWSTDGSATGDAIAFVHLYAILSQPPVVQYDARPAGGALPPGAWLPGVISERIVLDLSELVEGHYTLAVGLYDPLTFERLEPLAVGEYTIDARRVLVTEIEVNSGDR